MGKQSIKTKLILKTIKFFQSIFSKEGEYWIEGTNKSETYNELSQKVDEVL